MPLPVVLFDFGGVVIRTPFELVPALEERAGLPAGALNVRGPFDVARDQLWRRLMSGEFSEREYWRRQSDEAAPVLGLGGDDLLLEFFTPLFDLEEDRIVRPEVRRLIEDLVGGEWTVAALTNDLARFHPPDWIDRMSIIQRFEPLIDLSHAEMLKPHPDAYAFALQRLGAAAGQVLFIDDQPVNVEGARAVGIESIRFDVTDPARSVGAVRARLGLA